jgi:hypothetical protein
MKSTSVRMALAAPLVLLAIGVGSSGAAGKFRAPRTSWGDPVIQGFYNNNTDVPFERARELGDKAFYTEQEYQESKQPRPQAPPPENRSGAAATSADVHYDTGEFGLDPDQSEMVKSLRTSIIMQPANGRLPPLTKQAQQRSDAARAIEQAHQYDSAQDRPLAERCVLWPHEGPPLRPVGYNSHVQITQSPGYVVFETEMIHDARIIPITERKPDFGGLTRWQGNSWGHWQGDTLVIETTGINGAATPRGSNVGFGPEAKVIEKITRTGPETILYEFSVTDPSLWDVSWGGEFPMELTEGPMFEYACHEGNYGIANTLRGAREEEKTKARQGK